jgi:hypothetical protein
MTSALCFIIKLKKNKKLTPLVLQTTANNACVYVCFLQASNFKYIDLYEKDR